MRVSAKASETLYAAIRRDGGTHNMLDAMQTRTELYAAIDYAGYEALDQSIVSTIIPQGMSQDNPTTENLRPDVTATIAEF